MDEFISEEIGEERKALQSLISTLEAADEAAFGSLDKPVSELLDILMDVLLRLSSAFMEDRVNLTARLNDEVSGGGLYAPADEIGNAKMIHIKGMPISIPYEPSTARFFQNWAVLVARIRKDLFKSQKRLKRQLIDDEKTLITRWSRINREVYHARCMIFPDQTEYLRGLRLQNLLFAWGFNNKNLQDLLRQITAIERKARKTVHSKKSNPKHATPALRAEVMHIEKQPGVQSQGLSLWNSTIPSFFDITKNQPGETNKVPGHGKTRKSR